MEFHLRRPTEGGEVRIHHSVLIIPIVNQNYITILRVAPTPLWMTFSVWTTGLAGVSVRRPLHRL